MSCVKFFNCRILCGVQREKNYFCTSVHGGWKSFRFIVSANPAKIRTGDLYYRSNRSPLFYFFSFYARVLYELRLTTDF